MTPKVSVCSQVLDSSAGLKVMIQSVVDQTFKDWELVIVDDGSAEDLKSVVDAFNDSRIRLIRLEQNVGIPKGINLAMKEAKGEYIALLAADEFITPDKLEVQVEYMDANKAVGCTWGLPGKMEHGAGLRPAWEQAAFRAHNRSSLRWVKDLIDRNAPIGGASLLMRADIVRELGYMDESFAAFSDHELYCRFFEKHVGVVLPFRFADEQPDVKKMRQQPVEETDAEYQRVKALHPVVTPPVTGKVSIGIPCFNHAKYLPTVVAAVLAQTHQDIEVMILNDGGTDDFNTVVQQFTDPRIKVMGFTENLGVWEAQNQMAFRATGDFYVPLAADDTIEPNFIEKCLAKFAENPWLEMVSTQTDFINEAGAPFNTPDNPMLAIPKIVPQPREEMLMRLHGGNVYFGAGMYRTQVISELGGWEKQYKVLADYQMYLKLLQREAIGVIEESLTHTRVDGKNLSLLDPARAKELPWLYHEAKKPYFRQQLRVVIATPFYELKGFSPYISSLVETVRLLTAHGIDWRFLELSGDSYVHRARNTMVDTFMSDPANTDLFFLDSDMSWDPMGFVKMCLLPDEIVGGSYPVKNCWEAWTSIPNWQEENGESVLKGRNLPDGSALIEAHVLAGGFLRIKRSVFEKFQKAYPDLWYIESSSSPGEPNRKFTQYFGAESINHKFHGEDHLFSKHLRDMGMRLMIYPNVMIHHWGYKNFPGNFDHFLRKKREEAPVPLEVVRAAQAA